MERIVHQDVHPLPLPLAQGQAWTSSSSSCLRRPCSLPARNQRPCSSAQQDNHRWVGGRAAGFPVRHNPSLFPGHVASRRDGAAGWAHHKHQKHSLDQVSFDQETLFRLFELLFFFVANTFLKGTAVHNEGDEVELVQPPAPPGCEVAQRQEDRGGVEGDGQGHQLHHHRPQCSLLPGSSSFFLDQNPSLVDSPHRDGCLGGYGCTQH